MKRLYRVVCKRWGPEKLTLSAYAWKYAQETGNTFWRDRIDGLFLLLIGQKNHCQQQHQRETRADF
jgi:hypothetical protein